MLAVPEWAEVFAAVSAAATARLAISVGEPLDPARYAAMKRDAMLADLHRGASWAQHAARRS